MWTGRRGEGLSAYFLACVPVDNCTLVEEKSSQDKSTWEARRSGYKVVRAAFHRRGGSAVTGRQDGGSEGAPAGRVHFLFTEISSVVEG